jgi:hypothetical protein
MPDRFDSASIDAYKVLQVDPEADPEVVQAAYRRLAQKFHPDVAPGPEAAARMAAINRAWSILRTAESRARYDRERAAAVSRLEREERYGPSPGRQPAQPAAAATATEWSGRSGNKAQETVSRDWTGGRSTVGGGYDPQTMRAREGLGAAGAAPGNPSGAVINFGRYAGWSLGEIARRDVEYLEWLDRVPIGRQHRDEIDQILRKLGRRRSAPPSDTDRRGLFRRR